MNFSDFFKIATGNKHYDWQRRLAEDSECRSRLIDIPTGLGKTAGVVNAWLWNRLGHPDKAKHKKWPRRLVYCLPMRTLVEQTEAETRDWVQKLFEAEAIAFEPRIVVLMGGEDLSPETKDWDLYPEEPAILIGTQDMLLSRALNRGYGMSRYRWPMHFALLNNDALWVMDEVQLMGPGLAATTQLEGFHNACAELGSEGCYSWWMSATIRPDWLKTVDMPDELLTSEPLQLTTAEIQSTGRVKALRTASKLTDKSTTDSGAEHLKAVAKFIDQNRSGKGMNLVVVNTVKRARKLFLELKKLRKNDPDILLLHSQFRPKDRQRVLDEIKQDGAAKVIVSTQVIEAGVDLSAQTLFTELAPWSSLVQRFGRCNRWLIDGRHHFAEARIYWFDLPEDKDHLPYTSDALNAARERLNNLSNAAIQHIENITSPDADRPDFRYVIRRKDLVDLFDTTPDLAGADLDIDRFIRDADDSHVQVFWRNWLNRTPNGDADFAETEKAPQPSELCTVSIGDFRNFVKKQGPAYRWNPLDRKWQTVSSNDVYPGQVYLLHTSQGGYDEGNDNTLPTGWNGDTKAKVQSTPLVHSNQTTTFEAYDGDATSEQEQWQTVAQHTDDVCDV
ncbi:MAG: CRISPR-associated helicase Cas3', partial [Verrucomicrobia bacterium]|nr:CRISPR-associated helicase Cas3' [Verrucomicrobiota bacterium]